MPLAAGAAGAAALELRPTEPVEGVMGMVMVDSLSRHKRRCEPLIDAAACELRRSRRAVAACSVVF